MALPREKEVGVNISRLMVVQIHEGRVVISDYSRNDDRNTVLAFLGAVGVQPEVHTESLCG